MKLRFVLIEKDLSTEKLIYEVFNRKGEHLGGIEWDEGWKCYVWFQQECIQMSSGCLKQVVDKMNSLEKSSSNECLAPRERRNSEEGKA